MRAEVDEASVIISKGQKAFRTNGGDITLAASSVVFAGDDADSAVRVDTPTDATYENKYVKIMPDFDVTVSFDAYGGTDTMADATIAVGQEYTLRTQGVKSICGTVVELCDEKHPIPVEAAIPVGIIVLEAKGGR